MRFLIQKPTDTPTSVMLLQSCRYSKSSTNLFAYNTSTLIPTGHRNLLSAFNAIAMEASLGHHKVLKVVHWALFLRAFSYRIEHVPGDANKWFDIKTRWMRNYRSPLAVKRVTGTLSLHGVTEFPSADSFQWPFAAEQAETQPAHPTWRNFTKSAVNSIHMNGLIRILENVDDLKLHLVTISYNVKSDHRDADPTWHALRELFTWKNLCQDTHSFVSFCFQ